MSVIWERGSYTRNNEIGQFLLELKNGNFTKVYFFNLLILLTDNYADTFISYVILKKILLEKI